MKPRLSWDATAEITRSNRRGDARTKNAGPVPASSFVLISQRVSNPQSTRGGHQPSGPLLGGLSSPGLSGGVGLVPGDGVLVDGAVSAGVCESLVPVVLGAGGRVRPPLSRL